MFLTIKLLAILSNKGLVWLWFCFFSQRNVSFLYWNQSRVLHANQCHEIIPSATNLILSKQKMKRIFTSETSGTQNISSHLTTSARQVFKHTPPAKQYLDISDINNVQKEKHSRITFFIVCSPDFHLLSHLIQTGNLNHMWSDMCCILILV